MSFRTESQPAWCHLCTMVSLPCHVYFLIYHNLRASPGFNMEFTFFHSPHSEHSSVSAPSPAPEANSISLQLSQELQRPAPPANWTAPSVHSTVTPGAGCETEHCILPQPALPSMSPSRVMHPPGKSPNQDTGRPNRFLSRCPVAAGTNLCKLGGLKQLIF